MTFPLTERQRQEVLHAEQQHNAQAAYRQVGLALERYRRLSVRDEQIWEFWKGAHSGTSVDEYMAAYRAAHRASAAAAADLASLVSQQDRWIAPALGLSPTEVS